MALVLGGKRRSSSSNGWVVGSGCKYIVGRLYLPLIGFLLHPADVWDVSYIRPAKTDSSTLGPPNTKPNQR